MPPSRLPAVRGQADDTYTRVLGPARAERKPGDAAWPRVRGYEIQAVLGSGGMGIVYRALHRDLRRPVALKTLKGSALADPEYRDRFRAEAEAVARLQHPHIIQVFEIGTVEPLPGEVHPSPFIALELVLGGSLVARAQSPQPPAWVAGLVEKLARAAHAAHRLGVVHRDLKPANVLLTPEGEPKIADFGLAKQLDAERDPAGRFVTQAGVIIGTPEYMAPEQAVGGPPAPAVDIYALGVLLYELLTARVPYGGATPIETLEKVLRQEPAAPRRLRPAVPRDLETICLKCLEKEPAKRYETAEALADDLARWAAGRPIRARAVGPAGRAARWARRSPGVAALSAAVVAVALSGLAGVLWQWRDAVAHAAAADRATADARAHTRAERWERYRADLVASFSALQVNNVAGARRALEAAPAEHRNWEWRHFHSRLDLARDVLPALPGRADDCTIAADAGRVLLKEGKSVRVWDVAGRRELLAFDATGPIDHVKLSPDGRLLAYRTADREVVLRDVDSGRVRAALAGHEGTVHAVEFSRDGARLLCGMGDDCVRIWDVASGRLVARLGPDARRRGCVGFSPDGRRVAVRGADNGTVIIQDTDGGRPVALTPPAPAGSAGRAPGLHGTKFERGGRRLLTVESHPSNLIHLWDAGTGRRLCTLAGVRNTVQDLAFSPDGTRVAAASRDQTVRVWDAATGQALAVLRGHRGLVNSVEFSPDGRRVVSCSEDHTVRLWDVASGEALAVLNGHTGNVPQAAFAAGGAAVVSASHDGTARVWDVRAAAGDGTLRGHSSFVYGVAFHPDGARVASAAWDGTARLWDAATGRQTACLNHGEGAIVTSVAFHPAGERLATRARDAVRLWDVASGHEVHRWAVPSHWWRDTRLAFSPRGDLLASAGADREIRVWDVASRAEVAVLRGHQSDVRDLAFSPDGRWLASVADDGDEYVRVWDLKSKTQAHALPGHKVSGYCIAFGRDGALLATGGVDGTVRLFDMHTWEPLAVVKLGTNVYGLAFTPDDTRLACAGADNTIRLLDVATRQEVAELRGHAAYVHALAFSPDGSRLASASGDTTLRVWDTTRGPGR